MIWWAIVFGVLAGLLYLWARRVLTGAYGAASALGAASDLMRVGAFLAAMVALTLLMVSIALTVLGLR
jgi:hypothetical protein